MLPPRFKPFLTLSILCAAPFCAVAADPPQDSSHSAKEQTGKAAPKSAPNNNKPGVVVFVDPATGQIRQPSASEIGDLSPSPNAVAPKAPEPSLMQGPGGSVGARLGEESLTYMVVTAAPDGKLAMDCVTGSKAADAQVRKASTPADKTTIPAVTSSTHPQDSHEIKVPR